MKDQINYLSLQKILTDRKGNSPLLSLANLPHPYLLKDMEKAAERLALAITNKEKILLVGDYDVDGVTSTAIIVSFFRDYGFENFQYIIPDRFKDGYGVSPSVLEQFKDQNLSVVFTVDNGISAVAAGNWCSENNIDLIITDHHTVPDKKPKAYAIVDQKQDDCTFPFDEICGAEIAWYLVRAISMKLGFSLKSSEYTDFVGLAIVADVMPLIDMNRALLIRSLKLMNISPRPFFVIGKELTFSGYFTSEELAFKIAPMINAAGRLVHAHVALKALLSQTVDEAKVNFQVLEDLNEERKLIESDVTKESIAAISEGNKINIVYGEGWHEGVVGIVASRLVDKFKKPAIVFSLENGKLKGSGRSLGEVDLIQTIYKCKHHLLGAGGHKLAAGMGLLIENINPFIQDMNKLIEEDFVADDFIDRSNLPLGVIAPNDISFETISLIDSFEPYGEQNRRPSFIGEGFVVEEVRILKEKHYKFKLSILHDGLKYLFDAIHFNFNEEILVSKGDVINIEYTIGKNAFRGHVTIQLMVNSLSK